MKRTIITIKNLTYTIALTSSLLLFSCSKENSKASEAATTETTSSTETGSATPEETTSEENAPTATIEETAQKYAELNCKSQEIALKMQKQGTQDLTQLTNDQNEITAKLAEVEDDAKHYEKQNKDAFEKLVAKYMGNCKH